jgi:hypothetical protein
VAEKISAAEKNGVSGKNEEPKVNGEPTPDQKNSSSFGRAIDLPRRRMEARRGHWLNVRQVSEKYVLHGSKLRDPMSNLLEKPAGFFKIPRQRRCKFFLQNELGSKGPVQKQRFTRF